MRSLTIYFLLALICRTAAALLLPVTSDELGYSMPSIECILKGDFLIYMYHNTYFAPINEYVAAVLFHLFGPSVFSLRASEIIFGSLGAVCWWQNLKPFLSSRWQEICLAGLLAFPSSSFLAMGYSFGFFLMSLMFMFTIQLTVDSSLRKLLAFGFYCGICLYLFPLIKILIVPCWLVLLITQTSLGSELPRWVRSTPVKRRTLVLILLAGTFFALFPTVYHYYTRPTNYHPPAWVIVTLVTAFLTSLGGALILFKDIRLDWKSLAPYACCLVLMLVIPAIPEYFFQKHFASLSPETQNMYWSASKPCLEHLHNWPVRTIFTLQQILPQAVAGLLPYAQPMEGGYVTNTSLPWYYFAMGFSVWVVLLVGSLRSLTDPERRLPGFILSFCIHGIILLFFTSYYSANYYNFRYLSVFVGGMFFLADCAFKNNAAGKFILTSVMLLGAADLISNFTSLARL